MHNRFDNPKAVTKVSEYIMKQQNRLLGHVIRADPEDPLRQVIFPKNTFKLREILQRRVGKPRNDWTINTKHGTTLCNITN